MSEDRVLRERYDKLARAIDRETNQPTTFKTARQLVQVYDGGSLPTTAGKFFLSHPVQVTGSENEGETPTYDADTDAAVPVLVLGKPAVDGDLLVASSVGGRWVAEKGDTTPATYSQAFIIVCCNGAVYSGRSLTVSVYNNSDTTLLASGSTSAGGLTLSWLSGGTLPLHLRLSGQSAGYDAYDSTFFPSLFPISFGPSVASGSLCCGCCEPVTPSQTVTASFTSFGVTKTLTLTSNHTNSFGAASKCKFAGSAFFGSFSLELMFDSSTFQLYYSEGGGSGCGPGPIAANAGHTCVPINFTFGTATNICGAGFKGPVTVTG